MSARAMLKAVETRLRSAAIFNDQPGEEFGKLVGIQAGPKPPSFVGQVYYSVWWPGTTNRLDYTVVEQIDRDVNVTVTITARLGVVPTDRKGATIAGFSALAGKDPLSQKLIDLAEYIAGDDPRIIHANYLEVMGIANTLIIGTAEYAALHAGALVTTNGFIEPLLLLGYGPVVERNVSWLGKTNSPQASPDVYSIDVRFGKARRATASDAED